MSTHLRLLDHFIAFNLLRPLVDLVRHVLRSWPSIRYVVLDTKVVVRTSGVVTRREQDTTIRLVFPDHVRCSRGRQDTILSNDELGHSVC